MKINLKLTRIVYVLCVGLLVNILITKSTVLREVDVIVGEPVVLMVYISKQEQEFQRFIEAIGDFESNSRYDIVSRYGFWGKYQFSPRTIKYLGFDVSQDEFLSNPELQDNVMRTYIRQNFYSLQPYIEEYNDTDLKGIPINIASILAGAHFAGATGVKRFLDSDGEDGTTDSNGMTLSKYMTKFSIFEIEGV